MTKVTIYTTSEFFGSVVKYEGTLIEHGTQKYAQYENAPFVTFIPKGKRKAIKFIKGYNPYLIIYRDWECPEPGGMFGESYVKGDVIISRSKYASFDDQYKTDFNELLSRSNVDIIADYRKALV